MTKFADKRLPVYFHVVGLFGVFLAIAIAMRFQTLGNPVLEPDEQFYHLVGLRMEMGALPYVDIFDRKPYGLFFFIT